MTEYQPKHMKDKEATLANWQNQERQAATRMEFESRNWTGMDGQVWALLHTLSQSRELNEILYDFDLEEDEKYTPKHQAVYLCHLGNVPPWKFRYSETREHFAHEALRIGGLPLDTPVIFEPTEEDPSTITVYAMIPRKVPT